jgi:hypothetical protein
MRWSEPSSMQVSEYFEEQTSITLLEMLSESESE